MRRQSLPERVTIFTDAQVAIKRMASKDPGPGQMYAIQARKRIAILRKARPDITTEVRWCPVHEGAPGNEKADEWAKLAAGESDTRGAELLRPSGRHGGREMLLPRSLAHLKREILDLGEEVGGSSLFVRSQITGRKYRLPGK